MLAPLVAFLVRFEDPRWISDNLRLVALYLALSIPLRLLIFYIAGMYRRLWRHASVGELKPIAVAAVGGGVVAGVVGLIVLPVFHLTATRVPFSVVFVDTLLSGALIALPRLLVRVSRKGSLRRRHYESGKRVLIAGAGDARDGGSLAAAPAAASMPDPASCSHGGPRRRQRWRHVWRARPRGTDEAGRAARRRPARSCRTRSARATARCCWRSCRRGR